MTRNQTWYKVKVNKKIADQLNVNQGDLLSTILFKVALEIIIRSSQPVRRLEENGTTGISALVY